MKRSKIKPTTSVTLEELFQTLNFYAKKDNYNDDEDLVVTSINLDSGLKARKILKKFLKDGFFYAKV